MIDRDELVKLLESSCPNVGHGRRACMECMANARRVADLAIGERDEEIERWKSLAESRRDATVGKLEVARDEVEKLKVERDNWRHEAEHAQRLSHEWRSRAERAGGPRFTATERRVLTQGLREVDVSYWNDEHIAAIGSARAKLT